MYFARLDVLVQMLARPNGRNVAYEIIVILICAQAAVFAHLKCLLFFPLFVAHLSKLLYMDLQV